MPQWESQKISMAELFDMISGTSTGSLLATALVLPNPEKNSTQINKFFASDAINAYKKIGPDVFKKKELSLWWRIIGTAFFAIIGGAIFFFVGRRILTDAKFEEAVKVFK